MTTPKTTPTTGGANRATEPRWETPRDGLAVVRLRHRCVAGRLGAFLFLSDAHWDSTHCDRKLLTRHLDAAKKIGAQVVSIGDFFDAMQGRDDPRRRASELRPEYATVDDYYGAIARDAGAYLSDYPIAAMSDGNHEDAVKHRRGVDLTRLVADRLGITRLSYSGFVAFQLSRDNGSSWRYVVWYHHGYGGGGPVTKGLIQFARQTSCFRADAYIMGHVHEMTMHQTTEQHVRPDFSGIVERPVVHLRGAGYKAEHWDTNSWGNMRGMQPKPRGSWLLEFVAVKSPDSPSGHLTIKPQWSAWNEHQMPGFDPR